jgi:hypothetical protein
MDVRLQPEKEARLAQIAAQRELTTEELARDIICRYLEEAKSSAEPTPGARGGLGTEIAALFRGHGLEHPIPQLKITIESPFDPPKKTAGLRPADSRGRLSPHKFSRKPSRSRRKKRA